MAGGKGDLSWLLAQHGLRSIVVDPRRTDHTKLLETVAWLRLPQNRPIAEAEAADASHNKVREHSSAVERCGPHVAISAVMLRSSDRRRRRATRSARSWRRWRCGRLPPARESWRRRAT